MGTGDPNRGLNTKGSKTSSVMDIDYHMKDDKKSLHKHIYIDGVRQKEHIDLTSTEYDD